ncbi:hypothetical protein CBER1_04726 [Cercospora berteroae]|uniref:Uncharacterized protein n=1 Tax=Cercospora berteroae TaxID=357750 RepID=A0A2S6BR65_9PEZI|nr:hypothetical protein CBER1_04726 [Cercospora berteroae]
MFSPRTLAVLCLWTLSCYGLLLPVQETHEAGELYSPALLQARNDLIDHEALDAHEVEAIKHAEQGDLEAYHQNAIEAAHMSGDADLIASADGTRRLEKRDSSACVRGRAWHVTVRTAVRCWDGTYKAPLHDPHEHVINTARSILIQINAGQKAAAKAGAKLLLLKARQVDASSRSLHAARHSPAGSEVELYIAPRSPDLAVSDSLQATDIFGIHIEWHFLEVIGKFVSAIATFFVALTVCAEGVLEPPGFFLLAAVVWGLCGALTAEIAPAVIDLVGDIQGR